jgi:small subunit ribosomal protein S6
MTIRVDELEEGPSAMMKASRRDDRGERGGRGFGRGRGFEDGEFAASEEGVRTDG